MPIITTCKCGFRFKAPDKLAGRKARCPKCNEVVQIPALEDEAASAPIEEAAPPAEPAAPARNTSPEVETSEGPGALPPKEPIGESDPAPAAPPEETKAAEEPKPEAPAEAPPPAAASPTTRRTGRFRKDALEKGTSKTEKSSVKTEKAAPKPSAPAGPSKPSAIGEFLNFKRMITPSIVKLLFWLGEGLLVLYGLGSVIAAVVIMTARHGDVLSGLATLVVGPVSTVIFMLLWRVMCESALLYFQVFDRLGEIRDLLAKQKEAPAAPAAPAPPTSPAAPAPASEIPTVPAAAPTETPVDSGKREPAAGSEGTSPSQAV
ncbi:MAG: peptidase S1 and S6 [Planctomycetota bacterium]|nr:MAG: peptidase S1 and S6 [Planctomycetota bacterium]